MDADSYRAIMRHQAGAVAVIAVGRAGARNGLTATAVCSLSDRPATLLACVNQAASAHDLIAAEAAFSVNLLADDQVEVAACFSGQPGIKGEGRFATGQWETMATGAPVLVGALACLDCRLIAAHSFATHSIFIGAVAAGRARAHAGPLLYFRGRYCDLSEPAGVTGTSSSSGG